MAEARAGNRTPSPVPGLGVWPGIIGLDHHILAGAGPGMGINPSPAPGIHSAGNTNRFLVKIWGFKKVNVLGSATGHGHRPHFVLL